MRISVPPWRFAGVFSKPWLDMLSLPLRPYHSLKCEFNMLSKGSDAVSQKSVFNARLYRRATLITALESVNYIPCFFLALKLFLSGKILARCWEKTMPNIHAPMDNTGAHQQNSCKPADFIKLHGKRLTLFSVKLQKFAKPNVYKSCRKIF